MSVCVLDTDVVIAALDRSDAHHLAAAKAIPALIEAGVELQLSLINYAEVLVRPAEDPDALRAATDALCALGIRPVQPTTKIARDAARHRALSISLADGFALATAEARSATVATFDRRVRRAMRRLELELPTGLA